MPPQNPQSEELTLAEAAKMLGISPATLERWARAGRIASQVSAGGIRTFRREALLTASFGDLPGEEE